jgi:5-(carboxyamino)imidazole ribonucleotide synthase
LSQAPDRIGTLGILGGGQLARMTALAARRLGHATHVLDPEQQCPAASVVERLVVGSLDSEASARQLASGVDAVTIDTEHVALAVVRAAAELAPTSPSAEVLGVIQDKAVQKTWLAQRGYPVTRFAIAHNEAELEAARGLVPGRRFIKCALGGYDGRGQWIEDGSPAAAKAMHEPGSTKLVVEQAVPFECELSVLVARTSAGAAVAYPPSLNHHTHGVLTWSVFPAPLPAQITKEARALALSIAEELQLTGLLCVEMFLTRDQRLLVNELAPRPHNSYHASERGCATSQFEQLVRAVRGLPLGSVEVTRPAAIFNLLGDLWAPGHGLRFADALAHPEVTLHMYGKTAARPGRKMGHLTATGSTPELALQRVQQARELLSPRAASEGGGHAQESAVP